jgi:hypothetical protein
MVMRNFGLFYQLRNYQVLKDDYIMDNYAPRDKDRTLYYGNYTSADP